MPTYNQNLPLVPTEYVPIDYSYDAAYNVASVQQAAYNIAKVKSRYEDILGLDLTTAKSKETLSSVMKNIETDLQKVSGMDMIAYNNAKQALDLFKPITDSNGEYSFIMGDHAVTQKARSVMSQIESSKVKDKGAEYNPALESIVNAQLNLFSKQNDPNKWKSFYYGMTEYVPGYDEGLKKEYSDLEKAYREQVGDGIKTSTKLGDGTLYILEDKSIYADNFRNYLEEHLSERAKQQLKLNNMANYWQNISSYALIDDPQKKQEAYNRLKENYSKMYDDDIANRLRDAEKVKAAFEQKKSLTPATNTEMLSVLQDNIDKIDGRINQLKTKKITPQELSLLTDTDNWATGQEAYADYFYDSDITRMAEASAVQKMSEEYDDTIRHNLVMEDLQRKDLEVKLYESGLKYGANGLERAGIPEVETYKGEANLDSPEAAGQALYNADLTNAASVKQNLQVVDLLIDKKLSEQYDKNKDVIGNMSWNNAVKKGYIYANNQQLNELLKAARVDGKPLDLNASVNTIMAALIGITTTDKNLDYLTEVASISKDPILKDRLIKAKISLKESDSKSVALSKRVNETIDSIEDELIAPDGVSFASERKNYKINSAEDFRKAMEDFSQKHGATKNPTRSTRSYMENQDPNNFGRVGLGDFANTAYETAKDVVSYGLGIIPNTVSSIWGGNALNTWVNDVLDPDAVMTSFFSKYGEIQNNNAYLGYATKYVRPQTNKAEIQGVYNDEIVNLTSKANTYKGLNSLVSSFPDLVASYSKSGQGYGIQFSVNPNTEGNKDNFVIAFNNLAKTEGQSLGLEEVGEKDYMSAASQLNSLFTRIRIPTSAIDANDPKFKIDENLKFVGNNSPLVGIDISSDKLYKNYTFDKGQSPVIVSISNSARNSSLDNADLDLNINYPIPVITDSYIQRDANGKVSTNRVTGSVLYEEKVKEVMTAYKLPREDAEKEATRQILTNVTPIVGAMSRKAYLALEFIKFLNTEGRKYNSTKEIPQSIKDQYKEFFTN
jgi:hypothetical protein